MKVNNKNCFKYSACKNCSMWEWWCKSMIASGDWYPEDCIKF